MASQENKKYKNMEPVLQNINTKFVTIKPDDWKTANPILKFVIGEVIMKMKEVCPLFRSMYEEISYCGSVYDKLKINKPEEFDIDLKLALPKLTEPKIELTNKPGFVVINLSGWENFEKNKEQFEKFRDLAKFKDKKNNVLRTEFLKWMESIITKALNKFDRVDNQKYKIMFGGKLLHVYMSKSGPAMTMKITANDINMDVDFVGVFKMSISNWPSKPYIPNPEVCKGKPVFFLVPKQPYQLTGNCDNLWRLSFQEQERVLMSGNNRAKPALRLLKKLRDTQEQKKFASYFIKSVLLAEIDRQKNVKGFWNEPLSAIFMHMLKSLRDSLAEYKIPFYWYKKMNLIETIDKATVDNFKQFLTNMIKNIDMKVDSDPFIVARYLLTPAEQGCLIDMREIYTPESAISKTKADSTTNETHMTPAEQGCLMGIREAYIPESAINTAAATNETDSKSTCTIF